MTTFEHIQKAVQNKTDHLKDVAKTESLATTLTNEFDKVSTSLQEQKEQLPSILKGFDETQIHRITHNAEVKEQHALNDLTKAVNSLIAMLQGKNTDSIQQQGTTLERVQLAQDVLSEQTVIPVELAQESRKAVTSARSIIAQFNPQNMEEVKTMLPQLEQSLQSFDIAKKIYTLLPEGKDKQELKNMITEMESYKKELQEKKPLLNNPLAGTMFDIVKGQLEEAKRTALSMIGTFDRIVTTYSTPNINIHSPTVGSPRNTESNSKTVEQTKSEMINSILSQEPLEQFTEKGRLPGNLRDMVASARAGQYLTDVGTYFTDRGDPVREFSLQNIDPIKSNAYQIIEGGERYIRRFPEGTESKIYTIDSTQFQHISDSIGNQASEEAIRADIRASLQVPEDKKIYYAVHTHGVNRDRFALTVRIQP